LKLVIEKMELEDIPQVLEVDRDSYPLPWPASAYRREIAHNRNAHYVVLRRQTESAAKPVDEELEMRPRKFLPPFFRRAHSNDGYEAKRGHVTGYAGMWLMLDEAHITTIAVRPESRGQGLGELLLATLVHVAIGIDASKVTLEVRVSNETAQTLYRKYGFETHGRRVRYYSDNNEDAYIMTTADVQSAEYREHFSFLLSRLRERLGAVGNVSLHGLPLDDVPETRSSMGMD